MPALQLEDLPDGVLLHPEDLSDPVDGHVIRAGGGDGLAPGFEPGFPDRAFDVDLGLHCPQVRLVVSGWGSR